VSPAVVGGMQISITQAPWAVAVTAIVSAEKVNHCSGSILNETEVLTAAHCVYDEAGNRIAPASIYIQAGVSDFKAPEAEEQLIRVKEVRVHPYYVRIPGATQANPDDVAVLELEKPITLGARAEPIAPTPVGSSPSEGSGVDIAGFGEEDPLTEELNGTLNLIGMNIVPSETCGGEADALFVCARAPDGSVCFGDSGSGLTVPGSPATLTGVTNTVEDKCANGALAGFANVSAPEIYDFVILNDKTPPRAPRGGAGLTIRGVLMVGHTLTCEPGSWTNSPTVTYTYIDSTSGEVLQTGSSDTYSLTAADVGRTILCEVQAANAGGTAVVRTMALQAVEPAPTKPVPPPGGSTQPNNTGNTTTSTTGQITPPVESVAGAAGSVSLIGTNIAVQGNGTASVKVGCGGSAACHGKLTLSTKSLVDVKGKETLRTVPIGTASFSVAGGRSKTVRIKLGPVGRGLLSSHGRLSARLSIVKLEPAPRQSQVKPVELVLERADSGTK